MSGEVKKKSKEKRSNFKQERTTWNAHHETPSAPEPVYTFYFLTKEEKETGLTLSLFNTLLCNQL